MRWDDLFADLESQLEAAEAAELAGEVTDRSRREAGQLRLVDRLRPSVGGVVTLHCLGAGSVRGRLLDVGVDWLLVEETALNELLLSAAALLGVTGVSNRSDVPGSESEVARRLDLRWALRGLARNRAGVQVVLVDGSVLGGTFDRVGADHVDLAEHPPGEARRAGAVRQVRVLPLAALSIVRSWS